MYDWLLRENGGLIVVGAMKSTVPCSSHRCSTYSGEQHQWVEIARAGTWFSPSLLYLIYLDLDPTSILSEADALVPSVSISLPIHPRPIDQPTSFLAPNDDARHAQKPRVETVGTVLLDARNVCPSFSAKQCLEFPFPLRPILLGQPCRYAHSFTKVS